MIRCERCQKSLLACDCFLKDIEKLLAAMPDQNQPVCHLNGFFLGYTKEDLNFLTALRIRP